jgi:hypothetical protein
MSRQSLRVTRLDLILCAHRLIPLGSSFQHQGA